MGLGHIGASMAAGLSKRGCRVWGWDEDPVARRYCLKRRWIRDLPGAVGWDKLQNPLCVLALPETAIDDARVEALLGCLPENAIVTDVFSSKGEAIHTLSRLCKGYQLRYCWSHPLAGREGKGPESADPSIFVGATVLLDAQGPHRVMQELTRFWKRLGCRISTINTSEHQKKMASGSHLMHALAFALAARMDAETEVSPSVLSVTRVAKSDPTAWSVILRSNARSVTAAIEGLCQELTQVKRLIGARKEGGLEAYLRRSQSKRIRLEGKR